MTPTRRLRFALPLGLLAALVALPSARLAAQQGPECAMLDLRIVWMDSIEASTPAARCSRLRLVLAGPALYLPYMDGSYAPHHVFAVPVAVENTSRGTIRGKFGMRGDSITAVQHGRQLSAGYSRPYHELYAFHNQTYETPWTFGIPSGGLRPGARSAPVTVKVVINPLAQGLRLWFDIDPVTRRKSGESAASFAFDTGGLPVAARRFIGASHLPKLRQTQVMLRMPKRDLVMFRVLFGKPQDCPSGCFYSSAIGLQYKGAVGWLEMEDMDDRGEGEIRVRRDSFPSSALDAEILTQAFFDTLQRTASPWPAGMIRDLVVSSPALPRSVLAHQVEQLYEKPNEPLGKRIAALPWMRDDVDLLTLLAYLPYDGGKGAALERLTALIPQLVRDPSTSTRTMFLVARLSVMSQDTTLVHRIADHPNARGNTAILATLAVNHRELRPRMLAAVRASPRVRAMLAAYLAGGDQVGLNGPGRRLLEDQEAGTNTDVLLVLANMAPNQEIMWAASRRLPEDALRGQDYTYHPIR